MENDKKLPYEPSFGWVGRTDLDLSYIPGSHSRSGDYEASYPDYEAEARPRNEFCKTIHRFHNRLYNHGEGPY